MLQRIWAVLQKEFIHISRDRGTLMILLSLPLIQVILFGYAINMNVKHIPTVVADQSLDADSRAYIDAMTSSGYFDIVTTVPDRGEAIRAIDAGQARVGIVIPPDFANQVKRGTAQALVLVDGSDLFTSQSAYNAASVIAQAYATRLLVEQVNQSASSLEAGDNTGAAGQSLYPLDAHIRILYNPDLKDLWFVTPGIIAMLLQTQSIAMTTAAVVRERETGTIEQLLVTPIRPTELLLGKLAPNILLALFNMFTIMAIGVFGFGVPFQGDFALFVGLALVYIFSGLGLGLLISTLSRNYRQAQQLTMMISLLGLVLSGFIFPRYTMPAVIRLIGNIFPLTYFIPITRAIMTKGVGIELLWNEVLLYWCISW
jgi:ABC-2 type transport system permease protein